MSDTLGFFFLLMSNGVLIGLMYSLIALGFVLVYKATDAVNFASASPWSGWSCASSSGGP